MSKIEEFKNAGLGIDGRSKNCAECSGSGEVTWRGRPTKCRGCGGSGRVRVETRDFRRR